MARPVDYADLDIIPFPTGSTAPNPLAGVCLAQAEAALARASVSVRQARSLSGSEAEAVERLWHELRAIQASAHHVLGRIARAS